MPSFKMNEFIKQSPKPLKELEEFIARAIKKVGASKENELCKYIPVSSGGYIHHFTLKKMKKKQPEELYSMIERYIIKAEKPIAVAPKQRAARGSRKRRDQVMFTKNQLERMLNIAKMAGDAEIISVLSPKSSDTVTNSYPWSRRDFIIIGKASAVCQRRPFTCIIIIEPG